jgi:V/A-type H+-transporting ATPase subunit I
MAVSRMRKVQILAHRSVKADVISALREGGVLHVAEPTLDVGDGAADEARRDRERELSSRLSNLEYLRTYLKAHAPKKKPLESMFNPKLLLSRPELDDIVGDFDVESWYARVTGIESSIRSAAAEIARKESLAAELVHWEGLGMDVDAVGDTRLTRVSLLTIEASEYDGFSDDFSTEVPCSEVREISRSRSSVFLVAIFLREDEATAAAILKRHAVRTADVSGAVGAPGDAAERLREEADALRERIGGLEREAEDAAKEYDRVLAVCDDTSEELAKASVEERFGATRETFLVEGWIRGRDEKPLEKRLSQISAEIHMTARDPSSDEEVPIDLRNNAAVSPFEFVTTLYGRPVYWEVDPTPLLAPFFVLFFGLCVSDGGYGVVLAVVSFLMMRKMQPGGGRKLMQLLFMGGVATAIVGAVTGGWFGVEAASLPPWLEAVRIRLRSGDLAGQLFSPLDHPMVMLDFVFLLGIVQIFAGLAIKMVADFKERRWADGILDQLVWIVFLTFLAPLGADFILQKNLPAELMSVAQRGAMITGLIVVATGARKNPNPVMKVLGGVLKLYDVVGYFGDVLSYARLLALGLATGAIAMAINGVADMAGGIPVVGIVAAIVVLVGGHLFNLAVNCLGGFVHSARLQYLEYFSKFFTGGGREFVPFKDERRYSVIRD